MEEILGILNFRWQIIKLGFQIYIFGAERDVEKKEMLGEKETLENLQFSVNQSIWSLIISSFLAKLVPACVTSDVTPYLFIWSFWLSLESFIWLIWFMLISDMLLCINILLSGFIYYLVG